MTRSERVVVRRICLLRCNWFSNIWMWAPNKVSLNRAPNAKGNRERVLPTSQS